MEAAADERSVRRAAHRTLHQCSSPLLPKKPGAQQNIGLCRHNFQHGCWSRVWGATRCCSQMRAEARRESSFTSPAGPFLPIARSGSPRRLVTCKDCTGGWPVFSRSIVAALPRPSGAPESVRSGSCSILPVEGTLFTLYMLHFEPRC